MPLSRFARAISGWTTSPPSIATQALCTRILPVARSSEISATPAPSEPARPLIQIPTPLPPPPPGGPLGLPAGHLHGLLEHGARARRDGHALEPEVHRVHALGRRHLVHE